MKKAHDTIRAAYYALAFLDNNSWTNHREELFALCASEEKGHRRWGPEFKRNHTSDTATVPQIARMFAVKRIAEYLLGEKMPHGKDFLHCHKSCFYAAGLVDEFGDDIRKAWQNVDVAALAALNYTDFVKVQTPATT